MSQPSPTASADPRDLRAITADGMFFSGMVGLGETYVPAFVLAIGLGEIAAALVATLPMLAGAVFQLITPWAVRRLRSYRRWVVACAFTQALSFVPLAAGAWQGSIPVWWLAFGTISYWAFGMATGPAWNTWVTSLVPAPIRSRFFANRTRLCQATLLTTVLTGGVVLQWGRSIDAVLTVFAAMFVTSMVARWISAWFLSRQSETAGLAATHRTLSPRGVLESVRAAKSLRMLVYLLGVQATVQVASPFFTPYMLGPLHLSYAEFMALTAMAYLTRVLVLPVLGRVAHRRGPGPLLWWGALGIIPVPMLWLVSDHFVYLLVLQALAGAAWATLELATMLSFFDGIPERDRTSVLTAYNLGNAVAISIGVGVGSQLLLAFGGGATAYTGLFAVSAIGRLLMLPVLRGTRPAAHAMDMELRTLAVRPSAGAVQRPILATVVEQPLEATEPNDRTPHAEDDPS